MHKIIIVFFVSLTCMVNNSFATRGNVVAYGANGKDLLDDTPAFQQAIQENDTIYIPAGKFLISSLIVGDNKLIETAGFNTLLKQMKGFSGKQIIRIEGSNVVLHAMSYEGNIATDSTEFNYAVFIVPPLNKNTHHIVVKGVYAKDLRGDAVSIGNSGITFPEHVLVENVTVRNCYRNGISIVGGRNIVIRNVDVRHAGMQGIDIEAEGGPMAVLENVLIENVYAGNMCVSGRERRVKNINCKNIRLDGTQQLSTPRYRPMQNAGIIIYNVSKVHFQDVSITNMPSFAVFAGDIYTQYELLSDSVSFNNLTINKSAINDRVYNAYICVMGFKQVKFQALRATLNRQHILLLGKQDTEPQSQQVLIDGGQIVNGQLIAKYCALKAQHLFMQSTAFFECMNSVTLLNCDLSGSAQTPPHIVKTSACNGKSKSSSISVSMCRYNHKPFSISKTSEHGWLK